MNLVGIEKIWMPEKEWMKFWMERNWRKWYLNSFLDI